MNKQLSYKQLSSAIITENRTLVISKCSNGSFTLAQQMCVSDGEQKINVFLKGGIHISGVEGLYNLRDALNMAIGKLEKK